MRVFLVVIGVLLVVLGVIWVLQGANVLPGSFMTGDYHWIIYGAIAAIAGIVIIVAARRRRLPPPAAPPASPGTP